MGTQAHDILEQIIVDGYLECSNEMISAAQYGTTTARMANPEKKRFFSAISFTETQLNEIHTLLDIAYRQINLGPYGLVFLKENLKKKMFRLRFILTMRTQTKISSLYLCVL